MRVVVVCDFFLKYAERQALALRALGVEVALLCRDHAMEFGGDSSERSAALDRIAAAGVEIIEIPGRVSDIRRLPDIGRARQQVRRWRADVAHAHDPYDPRLLYAIDGLPLVTTVHDVVRHPGAPRLDRLEGAAHRLWRRRASLFVVHGERLRRALAARVGESRVAVVPHGVDLQPAPDPVPEHRTVLFFGRLEPYKGLAVLLQAMELVQKLRPDVRLVVAGSGPEAWLLTPRPWLDARVGYVPERQVDGVFREASLLVLPYIEGSQSGVGLLALSRGIPILVSDVGSLPELVPSDRFVVPPADADALAGAIVDSIDAGPDVRAAIHEDARRRFSWAACAELSYALYQNVLLQDAL
jgi:glycosyltransferase involved in cell wall biosynthesis